MDYELLEMEEGWYVEYTHTGKQWGPFDFKWEAEEFRDEKMKGELIFEQFDDEDDEQFDW